MKDPAFFPGYLDILGAQKGKKEASIHRVLSFAQQSSEAIERKLLTEEQGQEEVE